MDLVQTGEGRLVGYGDEVKDGSIVRVKARSGSREE